MAASSDNYQIAKGIVSIRKWTKLPTVWQASTAYVSGDYVRNTANRHLYKCVTSGTSAGSGGPDGTAAGETDGTAVWDYVPWVDVGNVPKLEFSAEVEKEEHFSSRAGIKTRDKSVVTSQKGKLVMTLEEATMENFELALLGELTGTTPNSVVEIFANTQIYCEVKCEGTNEVGPVRDVFFGNVTLLPGAAIPFIGETWSQFELEGEVNLDGAGVFGYMTEGSLV